VLEYTHGPAWSPAKLPSLDIPLCRRLGG